MQLLGGLIGGLIGALVGATAWAAVAYSTGYEIGFIAWAVGLLAGFGMAIGAKGRGGMAGGALAVILAIGGIIAGKFAVVHLMVGKFMDPEGQAIAGVADVVIAEHVQQGIPVNFIAEIPEDTETFQDLYPPEIWVEARDRYETMSAAMQVELKEAPALANPQFLIGFVADRVVEEWVNEGRSLRWPDESGYELMWFESDYPSDVWREAESRLGSMSVVERSEFEDAVREQIKEEHAASVGMATIGLNIFAFLGSFGFFDLLWAFLAVGTAFKLGSAEPSSSELQPQDGDGFVPAAGAPVNLNAQQLTGHHQDSSRAA